MQAPIAVYIKSSQSINKTESSIMPLSAFFFSAFPKEGSFRGCNHGHLFPQHPTHSFLPPARFRLSWVLAPTPAGRNVSNAQRGRGPAGSCSPVLGVFLPSWGCRCAWDMWAAPRLLPAVGWARPRAFLLHLGSASGLLPLLVNVTSTLYLLGPIV